MSRRLSWERIAAVVGGAVALILTAAAVAVAFDVRRWGCKSQAELERTRSPNEVTAAFANAGFRLTTARFPGEVIGTAVRYRGAAIYRYDSERATLWLLVCRERCTSAPPGLDRQTRIEGRYLRLFATLGNNIALFTTDKDRRSAEVLKARVQHVVNDLDIAEESGSRCYIQ